MATNYDFIESLCANQRSSRLRARVVRVWRQPHYLKTIGNALEMILVDQKGGHIQATIKEVHVPKFESRIKELQIYEIRDFTVGENTKQFKPCRHEFRIMFQYKTILQELAPSEDIPKYGFSFIDFSAIEQMSNDNDYLIDILGCMVSVSPLREFNTVNGHFRNIVVDLDNLRGCKLRCVLWAEFADQLLRYVAENKQGPYFVAIQCAKTSKNYGQLEVSNAKYSTRLLINPETSELNEFISRFHEGQAASSQTLTLSQITSQANSSLEEEFLQQDIRLTLDDLRNVTKPQKCIVSATIKSLVKRYKWWYHGCTQDKCSKKVVAEGAMWFCERCDRRWASSSPMFKVEIHVMDITDTATFILFCDDAEQLLNISVPDLINRIEARGDDPNQYPPELDNMLEKQLLFKLTIKPANIKDPDGTTYHVLKICTDPDIIKSFTATSQLQEAHCSPSTTKSNNFDPDQSVNSSKSSVSTTPDSCVITRATPSKLLDTIDLDTHLETGHSSTKRYKRIKNEK